MGYVTSINLPIGPHKLEVRGQSGTWETEVMVRPNEKVKVTAEIAIASAATSSGRDLGSKPSNNETIILIPKDKGDLEIYGETEVDKKAEPFGGMGTFEMFVKEEVKYPRGYKLTGQVQVQFVVEKNGAISDIKMIRGLMPEFDQEAVRAITELPYCWKPALKGGNPVRQTMVFAVPFER